MTPDRFNPAGIRRYNHADVADRPEYQALVRALGEYVTAARLGPGFNRALVAARDLGVGALIPDACDRCPGVVAVPFRVRISDNGATGTYRCRDCDYLWQCTFGLAGIGDYATNSYETGSMR